MRADSGDWQLDEIDLLRLARETNGGVLFTPSVAISKRLALARAWPLPPRFQPSLPDTTRLTKFTALLASAARRSSRTELV